MKIKDIIKIVEDWASPFYAEKFDNTGLLVGQKEEILKGILIVLDSLENVVEEAISKKCNLIIAYHPIIFKELKSIVGKNYVERVIIKAIQNNIAIYSIHTALDNIKEGVNYGLAKELGLEKSTILIPKKGVMKKLTTYVPESNSKILLKKLFCAGAGEIGNYSECSFQNEGLGSFKGNEKSQPVLGDPLSTHFEKEKQIHITFLAHREEIILETLFKNHPYEEVAYEIISLENSYQNIGMGIIGYLEKPLTEKSFTSFIKEKLGIPVIRHSVFLNKKIQSVAILCGSGGFGIQAAIKKNANVYLTADLKYHNFFEADSKIVLMDIGHFESEQFTKKLIYDFLLKKIPNFACIFLSKEKTNPVNYY